MKQRTTLWLLIAALIPYGVACGYAFPFADDFCFGWTSAEHIPFLQKFLHQYLYWNGRYTADVLVNLHPLRASGLLPYHLTLLVSLLLTPLFFYLFLRVVTHSRFNRLTAALIFTLYFLCYLPNITEGVYWFVGIVNYHLGNLLLLLQLTLLLFSFCQQERARLVLHCCSALLLVAAIGCNEIAACVIPMAYGCAGAYAIYHRQPHAKTWVCFAAIAVAASCFVFFSPGNFTRSELFPERYQLFHSLAYASGQTLRFTKRWLLNYPALALSLLLLIYGKEVMAQCRLSLSWKWTAMFAWGIVFTTAFVPYMATGILGQHRTVNYGFFFFVPLYAYSLANFATVTALYKKFEAIRSATLSSLLLITSVIALAFSGNSLLLAKDIYHHRFAAYRSAFYAREQQLKKHPTETAPLKPVPAVFTLVDARKDSSFWVDKCMTNYYLQKKR